MSGGKLGTRQQKCLVMTITKDGWITTTLLPLSSGLAWPVSRVPSQSKKVGPIWADRAQIEVPSIHPSAKKLVRLMWSGFVSLAWESWENGSWRKKGRGVEPVPSRSSLFWAEEARQRETERVDGRAGGTGEASDETWADLTSLPCSFWVACRGWALIFPTVGPLVALAMDGAAARDGRDGRFASDFSARWLVGSFGDGMEAGWKGWKEDEERRIWTGSWTRRDLSCGVWNLGAWESTGKPVPALAPSPRPAGILMAHRRA